MDSMPPEAVKPHLGEQARRQARKDEQARKQAPMKEKQAFKQAPMKGLERV